MNGKNELHLCNVAHHGDLNRRCDIGLKVSFALLFMFRLRFKPRIEYCITKCLLMQCVMQQVELHSQCGHRGQGTGCAIVKPINGLIFLQKTKGMASYLMAPVVTDFGCRRPFKARNLSPCVIPRSFST